MASLGQLLVVAGLAFLVLLLGAQDHGRGEQATGGGPAVGAAAADAAPPAREAVIISRHQHSQPSAAAMAESKRLPIPPSGPSTKWNYEANHEKPSSSESGSGRRRLGWWWSP